MISCNLQGGLGNQLFQIAASSSLAIDNNDEFAFNFKSCYTPNQGNPSIKYVNTIFKKFKSYDSYNFNSIYHEPSFSYKKIPYSKNLLLNGYFQSEKYFINNFNKIKELITLSPKEKIINSLGIDLVNENITSVHIRRGDYLKFKDYHLVCGVDYYNNAIKKIDSDKFIFLSDDIDWVKSNFISDNFYYSNLTDELDDLTLMSLCKNNIISNSSFSWWGAYLNDNKNKVIISPKKWFGESGPSDTQDVIPNGWNSIDN
jgi:hypothetical protein